MDILQQNQKKLQFYHQVKNHKQSQSQSCCMTLINVNELVVYSFHKINIYSFENAKNKSFNIIKTLKGHIYYVRDIKLMKNNKDLLMSFFCNILFFLTVPMHNASNI